MRLAATIGAALLLFASSASRHDKPEMQELLASIKGKEKRPAGEVFKNVKVLKDVPAGRFVEMMENFNHALGTTCETCHVEGRWEADEIRQKNAAREMLALVRQINDSLGNMENVETDASVNCMTCHRGKVKP
ncbi:MAG: c-type cytochrome [Acidobacteriota bacterium]|nr:c-type cytochrome [Acidobacteriota bacterium]